MVKSFFYNFIYNYAIQKYKIPKSCKVWPSKKVKKIFCEGFNTIAKNAEVYNVKLGFASGISKDSEFNNVKIGRYTVLAPRIKIIRGQHPINTFVSVHPAFYSLRKQYGFTYTNTQKFDEFRWADIKNKISVCIGNDVWIGSDVLIMEGISIGDGAIVASGSVVVKNVEPYTIVGGVPAKIIKKRFSNEDIRFLLQLKWWEKSQRWILDHSVYFENISILRNHIMSYELGEKGTKNDI